MLKSMGWKFFSPNHFISVELPFTGAARHKRYVPFERPVAPVYSFEKRVLSGSSERDPSKCAKGFFCVIKSVNEVPPGIPRLYPLIVESVATA